VAISVTIAPSLIRVAAVDACVHTHININDLAAAVTAAAGLECFAPWQGLAAGRVEEPFQALRARLAGEVALTYARAISAQSIVALSVDTAGRTC